MRSLFAVFAILFSTIAYASGEYCTASISKCQTGDIIVVGGEEIPQYCDYSKTIVPIRVLHNKADKNGTSISVNIVSCVYSGIDRKK